MSRGAGREEVAAALGRHAAFREAMDWTSLSQLFEADAAYHDAIHGWSRGREAICDFLRRTMQGSGPWLFVENWQVVDHERAVFHWTQRFVEPKPDGSWWQFEGVTALRYGSRGQWSEQRDIYDTVEAAAVLNDWAMSRRDRRRPIAATGVSPRRSAE